MRLIDYLNQNAGLSDADAAAGYNALPPVTAGPIPLVSLTPYLRKFGLMATLKMLAVDPSQPAQIRGGLSEFVDHVNDPRQVNLDTTDPVIAGQTAAILAGLSAAGLISADQVAGIYAMGGGLDRSAPVTQADVTAGRAGLARMAATAAYLTRNQGRYNAAAAEAERYGRGEREALPSDLSGGE